MPYQKVNGVWTKVGSNSIKVSFKSQQKKAEDQIQQLLAIAEKKNLQDVAKIKKPKLSFLQRLSEGVNLLNPTGAILESQQKRTDFLTEYAKDIGQRAKSAVTGEIPKESIPTGSDLVKALGVRNSIARFGLGFAADVLLDPSTYVGGAALKLAGKSAVGLSKAIPGAAAVAKAAEPVKDALGRAFVYGYKASPEALQTARKIRGGVREIETGIARRTAFETGTLSKSQREGIGTGLAGVKRKTLEEEQRIQRSAIENFNKEFPVVKVESVDEAKSLLKKLEKKSDSPEVIRKREILRPIVSARAEARAALDKPPAIIRSNLTDAGKRVVQRLQAAGKPIPAIFRDTNLEAAQMKAISRARQQGQKLVRAGKLAPDTPPSVYFPFIPTERAQKMLVGSRHFGVGNEGYLKQFKAKLKDDELVKDYGEAFARREAEVSKDLFVEREIRGVVKKIGKSLDELGGERAAKQLGYVPLTRKGSVGKFGEVLGYVRREDADVLEAFLGREEFRTLDLIAKRTGFDAVTSLFKRAVTGIFAPFHVRNWVSGLIQNYEMLGPHALSPRMMALGNRAAYRMVRGRIPSRTGDLYRIPNRIIKDETIELGGNKYSLNGLVATLQNRFFGGSYIADIGDATKYLTQEGKLISPTSIKTTIKTIGFGSDAVPFRAGRKVGEYIETQQKSTAFFTALDQGKTVEQSLELARRAGFDYRELTAFESKVMRRLLPFYAFNRFNTVLQIRTLLQNPQRQGVIVKFFRDLGESPDQDERESLPEFLANGFGIRLGVDKNGNPVYISRFGTPLEAFTEVVDKNPLLKVISNMNPLIKAPLELAFKKDTFRQKDLKDVYTAQEYSAAPKFIKDLLQIRPVEKERYLNGKPTGEKYNIYVANPERLLIARSLFTSRGATYLDQIFDGDTEGLAKALQLTTGIKPVSVDLERTDYLKDRDTKRQLEDILIRYGAVRQFQTTYEPKKKFNPGLSKQ